MRDEPMFKAAAAAYAASQKKGAATKAAAAARAAACASAANGGDGTTADAGPAAPAAAEAAAGGDDGDNELDGGPWEACPIGTKAAKRMRAAEFADDRTTGIVARAVEVLGDAAETRKRMMAFSLPFMRNTAAGGLFWDNQESKMLEKEGIKPTPDQGGATSDGGAGTAAAASGSNSDSLVVVTYVTSAGTGDFLAAAGTSRTAATPAAAASSAATASPAAASAVDTTSQVATSATVAASPAAAASREAAASSAASSPTASASPTAASTQAAGARLTVAARGRGRGMGRGRGWRQGRGRPLVRGALSHQAKQRAAAAAIDEPLVTTVPMTPSTTNSPPGRANEARLTAVEAPDNTGVRARPVLEDDEVVEVAGRAGRDNVDGDVDGDVPFGGDPAADSDSENSLGLFGLVDEGGSSSEA